MTLTKAHIVEAPAERNDYPKKQSFDTVETLLENIKRSLESGKQKAMEQISANVVLIAGILTSIGKTSRVALISKESTKFVVKISVNFTTHQ